jgi:hypothetical protein
MLRKMATNLDKNLAVEALTKILDQWLRDGGVTETRTHESETVAIDENGIESIVRKESKTYSEIKPVPHWVFERILGPADEGLRLIFWALSEGKFSNDLTVQKTVTDYLYRQLPFLQNEDVREFVRLHREDIDHKIETAEFMKARGTGDV